MRLLRRILITLVVTLGVLLVGVYWVVPVALSFYAAKKVPPVARVVPIDLKERSISEAPGMTLSYFGYEIEVPWSDLDETQTKLYPKDKPEKSKVDLHFHSGLRLIVSAAPPRLWVNSSDGEIKGAVAVAALAFGQDALRSDYSFIKDVYEFAPNKMHYWALSPRVHDGEEGVLIVKSMMLLSPADTGIFNIQNRSFKGFQQGNPQVRQDRLAVTLYSDDGSVEMIFLQKDYKSSTGVTQPEINRIVQSLRKARQNE